MKRSIKERHGKGYTFTQIESVPEAGIKRQCRHTWFKIPELMLPGK
jgi:hypothetical protein